MTIIMSNLNRFRKFRDKLQGSVAAYLRCVAAVNNQKNLKSVNNRHSYKQTRDCLAVSSSFGKVQETIAFLLVTLPNIHRFKKNFTLTLCNKPFLIWLLTTPPHHKYVATLPCNLSLMACFADINFSQGSVATYARCHLTANLLKNFPVKNFVNPLRFDRIMVMSLWPRFFGPSCMCGLVV